jgi:hypothetical protein
VTTCYDDIASRELSRAQPLPSGPVFGLTRDIRAPTRSFEARMFASPFARTALLAVASLTPLITPFASASAQDTAVVGHHRELSEFERRSAGVFAFLQSRPQGALANNIGLGYGFDAGYLFHLDRSGFVALRADVGFLQYGDESKRVPLSSSVGGRIQVKVSTNNNIVPVSIGPQLMWPRGSVRPYVNGGIGGQFFYTESHVQGDDDQLQFARTTNQWDKTMNWVAGGGVYIPVSRGRVKVDIDAGAQFLNGGRAQYLRPGSIEDLPDGQIRITPMESETHMVLVRLGVRLGV